MCASAHMGCQGGALRQEQAAEEGAKTRSGCSAGGDFLPAKNHAIPNSEWKRRHK